MFMNSNTGGCRKAAYNHHVAFEKQLAINKRVYGHVKIRYMKIDGTIGQFRLFQVFVFVGGFEIP